MTTNLIEALEKAEGGCWYEYLTSTREPYYKGTDPSERYRYTTQEKSAFRAGYLAALRAMGDDDD